MPHMLIVHPPCARVAFIPFLCAGDPDLDTTALALKKLDDIGADIIEVGVPYSDPLADGPTIQVRGQLPDAAGTQTYACAHDTSVLIL